MLTVVGENSKRCCEHMQKSQIATFNKVNSGDIQLITLLSAINFAIKNAILTIRHLLNIIINKNR